MRKVFVSSTVYDLLDARAEVEQLLRDMRLVPVLSGSATSGFQPLPDRNSIETCLANVRQCDAIIVILSQRYGRSLKPKGFPDLSATQLEYNEAKTAGKPIYMYVRDRLEADYCIHKKNRKGNVEFAWVQRTQDRRLFELLGEHRELAHGKRGSNWFDIFRDSVELKALIKRDFGPIASRSELEALIVENRVPIIGVSLDVVDLPNVTPSAKKIVICVRNVGTVPAYKVSWSISGCVSEGNEIPVLAPGQETGREIAPANLSRPWGRTIAITYYLPQGHCVSDEYAIWVRPIGGVLIGSGATCKSKSYRLASGDVRPFVIEDGTESTKRRRGRAKET